MIPDDLSDNALITRWVIEAELDFSRQKHLVSIRGWCTRNLIGSPFLVVTSDPATADQQLFYAPPA